MDNIIIGISNYEGLKLTGVKLSSTVKSDENELKYYQLDGGVQAPARVRVERLIEKWEMLKADDTKEVLEINIIKEHFKNNLNVEAICFKLIDMMCANDSDTNCLNKYGEIVEL